MKHKKRRRYQVEDLKVWCEAEVIKDDIVTQWNDYTCTKCCEKAVYGTSKKGYCLDEITRVKANIRLMNLKGA